MPASKSERDGGQHKGTTASSTPHHDIYAPTEKPADANNVYDKWGVGVEGGGGVPPQQESNAPVVYAADPTAYLGPSTVEYATPGEEADDADSSTYAEPEDTDNVASLDPVSMLANVRGEDQQNVYDMQAPSRGVIRDVSAIGGGGVQSDA